MTEIGFAKLNRNILQASWYASGRKDVRQSIKALYLHCVLKANWKTGVFQRVPINAGEFATSLNSLSQETGLSIRQVRSALTTLEKTGYLTSRSVGNFRIITVIGYDCGSESDKETDKKPVDKTTGNSQKSDTNKRNKNTKQCIAAKSGLTRGTDLDGWLIQQTREKL